MGGIPRPQKFANYKKAEPKTKTKVKKTRQTQEEIKAYHHEYYKKYKELNHDKIQAKKDIYYSENKQRLKEERATKVPCGICDKLISIGALKYHIEHLH